MTETQAIIDSYQRAKAENVHAALATVVRVEGSAYRRPGARMLITETGQTTGVLSGGCLERDVCERAVKVMRTGEPVVVKYDTTSEDDIVWGLGLGCNGVVQVLIEPANSECMNDFMLLLTACSKGQRRGAVATAIQLNGETGTTIGSRVLLYPNGEVAGEFFSLQIFDELREAVRSGISTTKHYEAEAGEIDVFIEVIEPKVQLVIFGAGHDAIPLVALARTLGWHTTVVDTQSRAASQTRFGEADEVLLCRPEEVRSRVLLTKRTITVMMTHNYLHDLELLKTLLSSPAPYIGCLGPRRRTERLLQELSIDDELIPEVSLDRLHAPVGLDIGAETSEEISLSIVAEIKATLAGRNGGLLRSRKGTIHVNYAEPAERRARVGVGQTNDLESYDAASLVALCST